MYHTFISNSVIVQCKPRSSRNINLSEYYLCVHIATLIMSFSKNFVNAATALPGSKKVRYEQSFQSGWAQLQTQRSEFESRTVFSPTFSQLFFLCFAFYVRVPFQQHQIKFNEYFCRLQTRWNRAAGVWPYHSLIT